MLHTNEILAMALLNDDGDGDIFQKQEQKQEQVIIDGEIQWNFVLHDGQVWHFRNELFHVRDEERMMAFKRYIRKVLKKESSK